MTLVVQKRCYACEQTKLIKEFTRRSGKNSQYRNICKVCANLASRRRFRTDPEARAKSRENMRVWRSNPENRRRATRMQLERNKTNPDAAFRLMICNERKRAPVEISLQQLRDLWSQQAGLCAVTQIRMTWGNGRIESTSLSIDRMDSTNGYVVGNVRLVCHSVNCFRGRMSDDEMHDMAHAIIRHRAPAAPAWLSASLSFGV